MLATLIVPIGFPSMVWVVAPCSNCMSTQRGSHQKSPKFQSTVNSKSRSTSQTGLFARVLILQPTTSHRTTVHAPAPHAGSSTLASGSCMPRVGHASHHRVSSRSQNLACRQAHGRKSTHSVAAPVQGSSVVVEPFSPWRANSIVETAPPIEVVKVPYVGPPTCSHAASKPSA